MKGRNIELKFMVDSGVEGERGVFVKDALPDQTILYLSKLCQCRKRKSDANDFCEEHSTP